MTLAQINTLISLYTKENTTGFPNSDRVVLINKALNRVVSLIMTADGRWQFEDTNNTDLPIATTALVSGQQDYAITTGHLSIDRVELKDSNGTWRKLEPYDNFDFGDQSISQAAATTGVPSYYDKLGNSLFLYPTPNFSQSASLKLYFKRGPSEFSESDLSTGTAVPGFNSLYHSLIALWVAYDHALANLKATATGFFAEIQRLEDSLKGDYGRRDRDDRAQATMKGITYR